MSIVSSKTAVAPVEMTDPLNQLDDPSLDQIDTSSVIILSGRQGQVDLDTDVATLADYLHRHAEWIGHCFRPLKVEALSADSYQLQFFRIGGLGFELEPCFGVKIWPEDNQIFRLSSIPLPSDQNLPYRVDCQSFFRLEGQNGAEPRTRIHWDLRLNIWMQLPGFLQSIPYNFVHKVGSKVVHQVTRSMSDRLTHNVCNDFYKSIGKAGRKYKLVIHKNH